SFFVAVSLLLAFSSCKKNEPVKDDEVIVVPPPKPVEPVFPGPTYSDNYTPLSAWASRSQWNLANVHDPTVEKSGEYYYMYGTDASYGNAHEGKGHFPYRRSKDLVNWEFMG